MTQLVLAIIGYGGMGRFHCSNIQEKIPEIRIKGVYDIRLEAREKAEEDGVFAYESFEAVLEDPEVSLVTIAVPNNFHKDYAIACMKAGKHVVCEKPVTLNAAELEEIIAVSKETERVFTVHQNRRFDQDYCIIQKILADGSIGSPYYIESRVQGSLGVLFEWRGRKENGGGMVLDWGVHLLDQILQLIDSPVVSVDAHMVSLFTDEVDDNVKILLRFDNRVSALIEVATNCFINLPRWHISCSEGTAVIEDWQCNGRMVQQNTGSEPEWNDVIVYTAAGPTRTMAPRPVHTQKVMPLPEVHTDWCEYYRNVIDVINHEANLLVKPEECLRVMKVIDAVFESDRTGASVTCCI